MKWIVAVIAVEAITEILIESELFNGLRVWFVKKGGLLGELISCGWCLSFWIAAVAFALIVLGLWWVMIPIAIHRLSNLFHDTLGCLGKWKWRE